MIADSYGAAFFGRISSLMVVFLTLTGTTAPFAAGLIFDLFASYRPLLFLVTALSLLAAVLTLFLPRHALDPS